MDGTHAESQRPAERWSMKRLRFLLDTNIIIPAEPTSLNDLESKTAEIVSLLAAIAEGGHQILYHPASLRDIDRDKDPRRRAARRLLITKYVPLPAPPDVSPPLSHSIGTARPGSRDEVDNLLLAAVDRDAVHYLVTEDKEIHRKAQRAGLQERVAFAEDALASVRGLFPTKRLPPPSVIQIYAHELDESDAVFDSLRRDYVGFDQWLAMVKRQHRPAWVIRSTSKSLAGVCISAEKSSGKFGLKGRLLKLCSFKIAEDSRGLHYGELLLNAVFQHGQQSGHSHIYTTVFPKHAELIALLEDFGFEPLPERTPLGEHVLAKTLQPPVPCDPSISPLDYHIRYGPPHLLLGRGRIFVVPIRPIYHGMLFPDAEQQLSALPRQAPYSHAIRKVYLCNAPSREIQPGSTLLFYRSADTRAICCIGVSEVTRVSKDPHEIARFVGKRTVYSYADITRLCQREVLAILFRHALTLPSPLGLDLLRSDGILRAAPRSITRISEEHSEWLRGRFSL